MLQIQYFQVGCDGAWRDSELRSNKHATPRDEPIECTKNEREISGRNGIFYIQLALVPRLIHYGSSSLSNEGPKAHLSMIVKFGSFWGIKYDDKGGWLTLQRHVWSSAEGE